MKSESLLQATLVLPWLIASKAVCNLLFKPWTCVPVKGGCNACNAAIIPWTV